MSKVKGWWYKTHVKQILEVTNPGNTFKCWFTHFKTQYNASFRRPTNTAQKPPDEKEAAIQKFHRKIREVQDPGEGNGQYRPY